MNKIIIRITFFISVFSCPPLADAQDAHFSQYFNTPLYINPANAGNGIEYMRATLIYRNQWASIASPFVTEGFLIDKKVNRLGFGFFAVKNSAGKASIKQLSLAGVLSYNQPVGEDNQISGALQIGMLHKNFDPSQMTFDSQFSEDTGFDPAVNSGEEFSYTSITRPDVGMGIMWQRGFANRKINFKPFAGISISHINKPSETFIASDTKLPIKSTLNLGSGIMLKDNLELRPSVLFAMQDHFHELNFGAVATFTMENNNKFQAGLYDRNNDAMIIYAGYQVNRIFIGTSYDINMSQLKNASNGNGGFEISLSFMPKAPKKSKAPTPKKPAKTLVHKVPQKVQKTEKKTSVKPVEQKVNIPEKLEAVPIKPSIERPKEEIRVTEVSQKEVVKPEVTQETPSVAEKKTEPKSKVQETPVESTNVSKEQIAEKKTEATIQKISDKEPVQPKLHTVYLDPAKMVAENKAVDTDGDGILDKEDHCPFIKGGINTKGCPDSDGDGIIDMMDECPMEPGSVDRFGCPEKTPAVSEAMLIKKFSNIQFETGSSKIKTVDMFDVVEAAIDLLYQNPNSRVILSGHTDSEGNDLYNMHLSEKRNLIVKNYLTKKGIAENRIQLINYGETMPLDNNTTPEGRAKNRRVELNIIKK